MSKQIHPIHTIIGHTEADLDVYYPAWLAQTWEIGQKLFPGVQDAKWLFLPAGTERYLGKDTDELLADGYLMLDLGGGLIDHHKVGNRPAKEGECAATLMAKHLGLTDRPEIEGMLNYVKQNDLSGAGMTTDLASRVRRLYAGGATELEVRDYVYAEFEADYAHQKATFEPAVAEFKQRARTSWLELPGGKKLKIAVIESDNEAIGRVCRSKHGEDTAVLIQRRSSGHVFIAATPRFNLNLRYIAGLLRLAEAWTRGLKLQSPLELLLPGAHLRVSQWYYFRSTDGKNRDVSLMNGSPKNTEIEPTWISLKNIETYVRKGLTIAHSPEEAAALNRHLQGQPAA